MIRGKENGRFESSIYSGLWFDGFSILEDTGVKSKDGSHIWKAKCDCGEVFNVSASRVKRCEGCGCRCNTSYHVDNTEDLDGEVWKSINEYGDYMVSNKGRVKSTSYLGHNGVCRIMKPAVDHKGYMRISLWGSNGRKSFRIHRLVAEAFIPNEELKTEVNHKDGNKQNNVVENLEWCSARENVLHAYQSGLKEKCRIAAKKTGETFGKAALQKYIQEKHKVPVLAVNLKTGERLLFDSQKDAALRLGLSQSNISNVLAMKRKSTGGYSFVKAR